MTALMAVIGDEEAAGYSVVEGKASVDGATGRNYFKEEKGGMHKFVIKTHTDSFYEDMINDYIK